MRLPSSYLPPSRGGTVPSVRSLRSSWPRSPWSGSGRTFGPPAGRKCGTSALLRGWTQSQKPCSIAVGLSPPSCSALCTVSDSVPAASKDWRWSSTGSFFSSSSLLRDLYVNDVLAGETAIRGLWTPCSIERDFGKKAIKHPRRSQVDGEPLGVPVFRKLWNFSAGRSVKRYRRPDLVKDARDCVRVESRVPPWAVGHRRERRL